MGTLNVRKLIHNKQLNAITSVEFSYNDLTILQDGHMILLEKDEVLELAQLIQNERKDQEYYDQIARRK